MPRRFDIPDHLQPPADEQPQTGLSALSRNAADPSRADDCPIQDTIGLSRLEQQQEYSAFLRFYQR
jgi:hypothetical protein